MQCKYIKAKINEDQYPQLLNQGIHREARVCIKLTLQRNIDFFSQQGSQCISKAELDDRRKAKRRIVRDKY